MPRERTGSISAKVFAPRMADQVAVGRAGGFDVGHVIQVVVGTAAEVQVERLAHAAAGAVAAAQVGAAAGDAVAAVLEHCAHAPFVLGQGIEFGVPFDLDTGRFQLLDQEAFVVVLREGQHEGVGAQAFADILQGQLDDVLAMFAQMDGLDPDALVDHHLGKAHLAVELQRARMHGHRPRSLSRTAGPVDDAHGHAMARQTYGEHQAGRTAPTMST
jgi:hypothetical protein